MNATRHSCLLVLTVLLIHIGSTRFAAAQTETPVVTPAETQRAVEATSVSPQLSAAIEQLEPLFRQIRQSKSTRATVELAADTIVDGAVVNSQKSIYQVASQSPDRFTIYLKDDQQRTRIYCDGKTATIALSESAYTVLEKPISMQQAVFDLPVPMGPYPEPVLALTLAGVDPVLSLATGMKSIRSVDRHPFRGETPAIHFEGIQEDNVQWDLWISQDKIPRPLRLRVDLTEMLRANGGLDLSAGYRYALRFDFTAWRIDHPNDESLFTYNLVEGAKRYDSVEAYFQQPASIAPVP